MEEDVLFITLVMQMSYQSLKLLKEKKRRWWVRPLNRQRKTKGFFDTTFRFIKGNDDMLFKSTRMTMAQHGLLLSLVKDKLKKTSIRQPISPECRMVITLMYLARGHSPNDLSRSFRMGVSTVRNIISETCEVFWKVLSPVYMPELKAEDWKRISSEFETRWHMPNCVGSIDGKHIGIKRPPNSGSQYFNFKGYFSTVLLAICDANYMFTAVDVGTFGTQSDAGIFRNSTFGKSIFLNDVELPSPEPLPNSQKVAPFYFVAESSFPLRDNLMRPYSGSHLDTPMSIFNYRLLKAHHTIENTFGILSARWRILKKCIEFHPHNAYKIVLACTVLHNFIKVTDKINNSTLYSPKGYCDSYEIGQRIDGMWRKEDTDLLSIRKCGSNNRTQGGLEVRNVLTDYFIDDGSIPYQPN